jgi:sirohydrochlorin ferrochelatase
VAHGTRKARGVRTIRELAQLVSAELRRPVQVAFVDVLDPTPGSLLVSMRHEPVIVVPAFLSRGYHVRTDIPAHVAASGHGNVTVTAALGPSPELARVVMDRLVESGWGRGDSVIMAAAGTANPDAQRDLNISATWLSALTGSRIEPAYAATGRPTVAEAVTALRRRGAHRVAVASFLLSDGLFQDRIRYSGAEVVSAPLGAHPALVRLIANRFRRASIPIAA